MDYQKALNILGLKPGFTEEELKKAHRELANIYHPDRNKSPEAEAKMKDINEARDYLAQYSRLGQKYYTRNTSKSNANEQNKREAERYRQEKLDELTNIANFDFNKHKVSNKIKEVIDAIAKIVHYYSVHTDKKDKETVRQHYEEYLNRIKYRFKELTAKFYKENGIDKNNVKETINYDCTLEELYEQLLKIRNKYGKIIIIEKKLEAEKSKYQNYAGYNMIEDRIENCVNDTYRKIRDNGFNYTQKDIDDMHLEIEKLFQTYHSLSQKISKLKDIVDTIDNEEIKNYYELIERNFYGGIPYSEFDEHIKELEDLIDKYQKENQRKINFKNNEQAINKLYQLLITRYSGALKDYNIVTDHEIINDYNNLLNQVLEAFAKGCEEFKDLEYFEQFNQITFKDVVVENSIIKNILQNSKHKSNISKVYIKRKDKIKGIFDETSFFWIDRDNMIMYQISLTSIFKKSITQEEYNKLEENYISLEELLSECKYVGKFMKNEFGETKYIIYKANGYMIYQIGSSNLNFIDVNPVTYVECNYNQSDLSPELRDKKVMQDLIEKQLKHRIDEYNQQHSRKNNTYSYDDNDSYGYNEPTGSRRR